MQARISIDPNGARARERGFGLRAAIAAGALLLGGVLFAPPLRAAEPAWVDNEIRLNLRTGAGTGFRIVGSVETGDRVEILGREENWTHVALADGKRGWIPAGYLKSQAPPDARLAEAEEELRKLKISFENATADASRLRTNHEEVAAREKQQADEIKALTLENLDLKSGPRWPEWITGASILSVGMLLGALLHRSSSRRPTPRIRL